MHFDQRIDIYLRGPLSISDYSIFQLSKKKKKLYGSFFNKKNFMGPILITDYCK